MSRHLYTQAQELWLECNLNKCWDSRDAFVRAFNKKFKTDISVEALANYVKRHTKAGYISVRTNDCFYTPEQIAWINKNAQASVFKDIKHFLDVFNATFGTSKTRDAMASYLSKSGITISTKRTVAYSEKGDKWLRANIHKYETLTDLHNAYKEKFNKDASYGGLARHCEYLGIRKMQSKKDSPNRGQFKKGVPRALGELPVGTIRYNQGRPYIKIKLCNGNSRTIEEQAHNYKEPFWKPLQKKIWEDHYGEIPEGYVVCSLNGNIADTDIKNIGIIDKRGTAQMGKRGWWTDNSVITGDGAQWVNLYYALKDQGVVE